jgi:hypothetical protein
MKKFLIMTISLIFILIFSNIIFIVKLTQERRKVVDFSKKIQSLKFEFKYDLYPYKFDDVRAAVESNIDGFTNLGDTVLIQPYFKGFLVHTNNDYLRKPYIILYEYSEMKDDFIRLDSIEYKANNCFTYIPKKQGIHHLFGLINPGNIDGVSLSLPFQFPFIVSSCKSIHNEKPTDETVDNELFLKFSKKINL